LILAFPATCCRSPLTESLPAIRDPVNPPGPVPPALALDAAFGPACACIKGPDGRVFHDASDSKTPHSQAILPMLEGLRSEAGLQWQEIRSLVLTIGPGSFTGVRIVAAMIAGLNAGFARPVFAVSSLAVTSLQCDTETPVWVVEDARAGDVYIGRYRKGWALAVDRCCRLEEIDDRPPDRYVTQTLSASSLPAWERMPLSLSRAAALATLLDGLEKGMFDFKRVRYPVPVYLRPSQAERHAI